MTAPTKVRVVVIGSSRSGRSRIVRAFAAASGFDVAGESRYGAEGVALLRSTKPAVVVLDASDRELAESFAETVMAELPTPILGVCAGDAVDEVRAALLAAGVVDVVSDSFGSADSDVVNAARLVARIRVVTRRSARSPRVPITTGVVSRTGSSSLRGVVAVGASTGGPSAVSEFLKSLPRNLPVPVLIVIHIGPSFGHSLADWLDLGSGIPVHQAAEGMKVLPGHAYVCPPDKHLVLHDDRLMLTMSEERHSCRPSVDVLFESVAEQLGDRTIGCLLTGIGRDGASGLLEMHRQGGYTIAQDEASCAVFGMPREAIALGAAVITAPPTRMAAIVAAQAMRFATDEPPKRADSAG